MQVLVGRDRKAKKKVTEMFASDDEDDFLFKVKRTQKGLGNIKDNQDIKLHTQETKKETLAKASPTPLKVKPPPVYDDDCDLLFGMFGVDDLDMDEEVATVRNPFSKSRSKANSDGGTSSLSFPAGLEETIGSRLFPGFETNQSNEQCPEKQTSMETVDEPDKQTDLEADSRVKLQPDDQGRVDSKSIPESPLIVEQPASGSKDVGLQIKPQALADNPGSVGEPQCEPHTQDRNESSKGETTPGLMPEDDSLQDPKPQTAPAVPDLPELSRHDYHQEGVHASKNEDLFASPQQQDVHSGGEGQLPDPPDMRQSEQLPADIGPKGFSVPAKHEALGPTLQPAAAQAALKETVAVPASQYVKQNTAMTPSCGAARPEASERRPPVSALPTDTAQQNLTESNVSIPLVLHEVKKDGQNDPPVGTVTAAADMVGDCTANDGTANDGRAATKDGISMARLDEMDDPLISPIDCKAASEVTKAGEPSDLPKPSFSKIQNLSFHSKEPASLRTQPLSRDFLQQPSDVACTGFQAMSLEPSTAAQPQNTLAGKHRREAEESVTHSLKLMKVGGQHDSRKITARPSSRSEQLSGNTSGAKNEFEEHQMPAVFKSRAGVPSSLPSNQTSASLHPGMSRLPAASRQAAALQSRAPQAKSGKSHILGHSGNSMSLPSGRNVNTELSSKTAHLDQPKLQQQCAGQEGSMIKGLKGPGSGSKDQSSGKSTSSVPSFTFPTMQKKTPQRAASREDEQSFGSQFQIDLPSAKQGIAHNLIHGKGSDLPFGHARRPEAKPKSRTTQNSFGGFDRNTSTSVGLKALKPPVHNPLKPERQSYRAMQAVPEQLRADDPANRKIAKPADRLGLDLSGASEGLPAPASGQRSHQHTKNPSPRFSVTEPSHAPSASIPLGSTDEFKALLNQCQKDLEKSRSTAAIISDMDARLAKTKMELDDMLSQTLELRVQSAISGNKLIRLDNPIVFSKMQSLCQSLEKLTASEA